MTLQARSSPPSAVSLHKVPFTAVSPSRYPLSCAARATPARPGLRSRPLAFRPSPQVAPLERWCRPGRGTRGGGDPGRARRDAGGDGEGARVTPVPCPGEPATLPGHPARRWPGSSELRATFSLRDRRGRGGLGGPGAGLGAGRPARGGPGPRGRGAERGARRRAGAAPRGRPR